jgi:hypothetical protein
MDNPCTGSPMTTIMSQTLVIWMQIRVMNGDNPE